MNILGVNAYHADSSACLLMDGRLVAAAEEERFTRIKHWAGLPKEAIRYCLDEGGIDISGVDHIAVNRDPGANLFRKALYAFARRPAAGVISDRLRNASKVKDIREDIAGALGCGPRDIKARIHNVEHHVAHLASSFFLSPFDDAAAVSVDGFGDFVGTMWGMGRGNTIEVRHRTFFPHSLGLFYLALTQYLGFPKYGDEYKVMGLAAYGEPEFMEAMGRILKSPAGGRGGGNGSLFELDLEYFVHHLEDLGMTWSGGEPKMSAVYSRRLEELLGPSRKAGEEVGARHKNIAASLQKRYEEVLFSILRRVHEETGCPRLALSGGCAMNSLANGKIFHETPFTDVYIQPAAGDAGGATGAACYVWNRVLGRPRSCILEKPYLGPGYGDADVKRVIEAHAAQLEREGCSVEKIQDKELLCRAAAESVSEGRVVGWFQGRMEWGPRALGNRSIVCDPRRGDMKDILNLKIKRRESFRPFAPSIHQEAAGDYFEQDYPDPFMLKVYKIRPSMRAAIPAVTHVDGTGRLQTVGRHNNPLYWQLIEEFRKITGVPVVLNTSFNENEPIVNTPKEALDCFLRTKMDALFMQCYVIRRA